MGPGRRRTGADQGEPPRRVVQHAEGVQWVKDRAETVDPDAQTVTTATGSMFGHDFLACCPGIQLDWGKVPGMADSLLTPAASTNYRYELAPKT